MLRADTDPGHERAPLETRSSRLPLAVRTLGRRITNRLFRPYLDESNERLESIAARTRELSTRLDALGAEIRAQHERTQGVLRHVHDDDPANRQRLYALRRTSEYDLAFTEREPLVSFVVPTHSGYDTLRDLALPSILGQTHSNLEVIVVGDGAPAETADAISELNDERVRYHSRNQRGPYPTDPGRRWYVVGTPPFNEGVSLARGRWIAPMADDDAVRPDHTEALVAAAQEHRDELCYGRQLVRFAEGETMELGEFPPRLGQFGLQAAVYHAGLRFFEQEPLDALYEEPNDWSLCRRMLAAGVRVGMIERIVVDKHERRRTAAEWQAGKIPELD